MGTYITTISIPQDQADFCSTKKIKISHITQKAIQELMELDGVNEETLNQLTLKVQRLSETIDKQRNFIEAKGLMDSFLGL